MKIYVIVKNKDGEEERIYVDHVILSLDSKSDNSLYEELKTLIKNLYVKGDAKKSRRIFNAV